MGSEFRIEDCSGDVDMEVIHKYTHTGCMNCTIINTDEKKKGRVWGNTERVKR